MDVKEEFISGLKTLRNDPCFLSVVLDKQTLKEIEEDCIKRNHYFHSTGDMSGIKHTTYSSYTNLAWSVEYKKTIFLNDAEETCKMQSSGGYLFIVDNSIFGNNLVISD